MRVYKKILYVGILITALYVATVDYTKSTYNTKTTKPKSENYTKQNTQENVKTNTAEVKGYRGNISLEDVKNYYNNYTWINVRASNTHL